LIFLHLRLIWQAAGMSNAVFFERDREISGDMSRDSLYGFARQDKL
jgi:hypothetical protein